MKRNLCLSLQDVCIVSSVILCYSTLIRAEEYTKGTDVTLTFRHQLRNSTHIFNCAMFVQGGSRPFVVNSRLDNEGLTPDQEGRFEFHLDQIQRNLTIELTITQIDTIDEGVYVLSITESNGGVFEGLYEARVHVTYPPGRAECEIRNQPLSGSDWMTVSCNATTGNDGSGYLTCIGDSKRLPYRQPVATDGGVITGEFWIDPSSTVRCCSISDVSVLPFDSCDDFVYIPHDETSLSSQSAEITNTVPPISETTSGDDASENAPCHAWETKLHWSNIGFWIVSLICLVLCILLGVSGFVGIKRRRKLRGLKYEVEHLRNFPMLAISPFSDKTIASYHRGGISTSGTDGKQGISPKYGNTYASTALGPSRDP